MATVFQSSSRIRIFFEKYPEKYCRISNIQQKPIIFFEDHEFRNNSEFSEHRSSCSEISLRKSPFRCASLLPRSFSERNIESPFQGQQMAQLARARCASGEVDWEDACPHSAGSETSSEKRTGSKRFRENCEECVSSETCSTHPKARENFAHCAALGQRTRTRRPRSESPRGDQPPTPPELRQKTRSPADAAREGRRAAATHLRAGNSDRCRRVRQTQKTRPARELPHQRD